MCEGSEEPGIDYFEHVTCSRLKGDYCGEGAYLL